MYHRLYIEFLYHFNVTQDYFECHEVMEAYWLDEGRNKKLQSFLQIAVGLYHYRNGNITGAQKLFEGALKKKDTPWNGSTGIDEKDLFRKTKDCFNNLGKVPYSPFFIEITDSMLKTAVDHCQPQGVED